MEKVRKKIVLTRTAFFLIVFSFIIIRPIRNSGRCDSPLIFFNYTKQNRPEAIMDRVISELGGLPKTDIDVHEALELLESNVSLPIYPVKEWSIKRSWVTYDLNTNSLLDDDPVYSRYFIVEVTYADGDTAVLQSSSWSYGHVFCPFVISMGIGPLGQLEILQ